MGDVLPVGISFYTFQTLSYTIDVYRGKQEPQKHLGYFALYVAFFPQLVAGPIERSTHLLPQFFKKHRADFDSDPQRPAARGMRVLQKARDRRPPGGLRQRGLRQRR